MMETDTLSQTRVAILGRCVLNPTAGLGEKRGKRGKRLSLAAEQHC